MKAICNVRVRLIGLAIALAAALFVIDLLSPFGMAADALGFAVVLVSLRSARRNFTVVALGCGAWILVSRLLPERKGVAWMVHTNRLPARFAAGVPAICLRRRAELHEHNDAIVLSTSAVERVCSVAGG